MERDNRLSRVMRRTLATGREALRSGVGRRSSEPAPRGPIRPAPQVRVESTQLGPAMDEIVARARRNQRAYGVNADYDLVREHFDHVHFLLQARALHEEPSLDPIRLFLRNGAEATNSPDINFSMKSYLERHPEHAEGPERSPYLEWLKRGRDAGEIADPAPRLEEMAEIIGLRPAEVVAHLSATRTDLQDRLRHGELGEMMARAAEIEPLIASVWSEAANPKIAPFVPATVDQVVAVHRCLEAAGFRRARLVLVINRPRWGGGRRMEGHLTHALADRLDPRDVVVLYTDDEGTTPPGRFPAGVREVDLRAMVEGLGPRHSQRVLVEVIRAFHAEAVVNINSRLLYDALVPYGRALSASERVFLLLFCNEQTAQGSWVGHPLRQFYRNFDVVEGVLTDSDFLRDWLRQTYLVGERAAERLHVLRAPVDPDLPLVEPAPRPPGRRPQVFWAGRWDRQKRIDVVLEVARRMPDVDFRMWGEAVLEGGGDPLASVPANVTLEGRYGRLTELDLGAADAWLYTSAWDGVPSQLLEVSMTGIPIVGSLAGGTGEILDVEQAWPVAEAGDPEAYEKALRDVLADPTAARERAGRLRRRLVRERSVEAFAEHAASVLFPATQEGAR
ncbi:glycosyltransferase family 4 protein [Nocardioides sp. DS6]|uniref:Glycosyltransferase family 4 protein n=1 Tax=Nocardioides eburneus TaxID=3231482 RepID=A0ABV3SW23_9ACTN